MTAPQSSADSGHRRRQAHAAAFDRIGARYDEVFPHKDGQRHAVDLLLARLPDGARVLDVGSGTGLPTARQLASAGCAVTGIDISPVMVELATTNVRQARFLNRDVSTVDATLGRFDAIVAFFSLLMLPRDDVVAALGRFHDVLRPGGWLAVGMVEADLDDVELPFLGQLVRLTGWPRRQFRQVLADAGFAVDVEDVRTYEPAAPGVPAETQLFFVAHSDR